MTREVHADDLGFEGADAETFATLPAREGQFSLARQLALWEEWVTELERGALWVPDELEAACAARDDLDDQLMSLPEQLAVPIFEFIERLDRIFRDWTVSSNFFADRTTDARWWWGRVPIRTRQRLFLFELWEPERYRVP